MLSSLSIVVIDVVVAAVARVVVTRFQLRPQSVVGRLISSHHDRSTTTVYMNAIQYRGGGCNDYSVSVRVAALTSHPPLLSRSTSPHKCAAHKSAYIASEMGLSAIYTQQPPCKVLSTGPRPTGMLGRLTSRHTPRTHTNPLLCGRYVHVRALA